MKAPAIQSRSLPRKPGVYLFRNNSGTIIYIGKAANLRDRVRSYFSAVPSDPKTQRMIPKIADIDFFITGSEHEALILESSLIKKHRPVFNVRLKDDKGYPYLKVTLIEEWPRVILTRRVLDDGSRYFGPYANPGSTRHTLNWVNKLFPYRTCKKPVTSTDSRPCLKYHINRCAGPCIGAISKSEYKDVINQVMLFLGGKQDQVIRKLKKKMDRSAEKLEFEKAALLRDQIQSLERLVGEQKVVSAPSITEDVIALARDRTSACAQVFFVRNGKLIGKEHFALEGTQDESLPKILTSFIQQFYSDRTDVPPSIVMQTDMEDTVLIENWLRQKTGRHVKLTVPKRGKKKQMVEMVAQNAAEMLKQLQFKWLADAGKTGAALDELRNYLNLPGMPRRIECYDISNIQGTAAVGSMVVFENGQPKSSHYRRFRIKTVSGIDDYAMMQEVLRRRFGKGFARTSAKDTEGFGAVPDLIIIDGGRGHLTAIVHLFKNMEIKSIPLAALAKENEEVFLPENPTPVVLPRNSQALYLLQRIRDEAHRFAISYHTRVRQKTAFASPLDQVPGIGPVRKKALLKAFGSVKGIRTASQDEIAAVSGMTKALAKYIKESL